jgi:hypothetical protein
VRLCKEHDALAEVLEWGTQDLGEPNTKRLPLRQPSKGFIINEVLKAEFAFA